MADRKLARAHPTGYVPWSVVLTLPEARTGTPDLRSPGRYLLWLARRQRRTLAVGISLGIIWMLSQAVVPWMVGHTIDVAVAAHDTSALLRWCALLLLTGVVQAVSGVLRHRYAVWNWLQASMRSQQLVGHHVAAAGTAVAAGRTTGEVVATVAADAPRVAELYDVSQRFAGALAAFVAVAVLLLRTDLVLGLLVGLGVPVLTTTLAVVVRPLQARQAAQREAEGRLTALGADTVAGLRVLRGIGGEEQFVARYRDRSQAVRAAGIRVAGVQATLDAAQVLLPGLFVVVLTWLGARAALTGRISAGQLVTLYGYAAFLVMPLSTATEALGKWVRARVAATRLVGVLAVRPAHAADPAPATPTPRWPAAARDTHLHDPASGLRLERGLLTALVSPTPDEAAALAYRLARLDTDLPDRLLPAAAPPGRPRLPALLDGVPADAMPVAELRRRLLVNEAEPRLFTGTLRAGVDPFGRHPDRALRAALRVADAHDVLEALPDGLDSRVEERGRSFSGGQRQRLALARALLLDPEVLVLVEPTSAVDAHTEARIADRLLAARRGRTTLLTTASPLLLDRADRVVFLVDGRVVAEGRHRRLLHTVPGYRTTVTRQEQE